MGHAREKTSHRNNHLQEAMALLIRNQAAFVEQIARNDQERLTLQRKSDERQLKNEEWQRKLKSGSVRVTSDSTKSSSVSRVSRVIFFSYQRLFFRLSLISCRRPLERDRIKPRT